MGSTCGKCFDLTVRPECGKHWGQSCNNSNNQAAAGKKITIMAIGACMDTNACPTSTS